MAENNPRLFHSFCGSEVQGRSAGFSALGLVLPNSRCRPVGLFLELLGRFHFRGHPRCWQDPLPCGCRPEVSVSLPAAIHLYVPAHCPLHLPNQQWQVESPSSNLPSFPSASSVFCLTLPASLPHSAASTSLRAHGIALLTQITQGKFPLLGSVC